jgi:hypothetical protein
LVRCSPREQHTFPDRAEVNERKGATFHAENQHFVLNPGSGTTVPLAKETLPFFQHVSEREGVDPPKAIYHARAVIVVLYEAALHHWLSLLQRL